MGTIYSTHLSERGVIRLTGKDKVAFLQGLITQDSRKVLPTKGVYSCILTPQGKFLHDLFIVQENDDFLLECEGSERLQDLLRRLSFFKLRMDVTLTDVTASYHVWALWGDVGATFPWQTKDLGEIVLWHDGLLMRDPRLNVLGARWIAPKHALLSPDALPMLEITDKRAYEEHRLHLGVAEGSKDLEVERSIPLMYNMDFFHAFDWLKGCYMGQELMARTKHRGLVRKRLFPVTIKGTAPACGTSILNAGKEAGEMRSSYGQRGLALLKLEVWHAFVRQEVTLECGSALLLPYRPEWLPEEALHLGEEAEPV